MNLPSKQANCRVQQPVNGKTFWFRVLDRESEQSNLDSENKLAKSIRALRFWHVVKLMPERMPF